MRVHNAMGSGVGDIGGGGGGVGKLCVPGKGGLEGIRNALFRWQPVDASNASKGFAWLKQLDWQEHICQHILKVG